MMRQDTGSQAAPRGLAPLSGRRVVQIGPGFAAAYCGKLFADLGAEVIVVEGKHRPVEVHPLARRLAAYLSAGKKVVGLGASGGNLLVSLCRRADVVLVDDPTTPTRFGLSLDEVKAGTPDPDIVVFSAFGLSSARAATPHSALTVAHGSGFTWHQSNPTSDPARVPPYTTALNEAEFGTGVLGLAAALWAMRGRRNGGTRRIVDVSVNDFLGQFLIEQIADYEKGVRDFGRLPRSGGREVAGGLVFILECSDGWIMVSPREDHQWARWMSVLGDPDFARDADLCGNREQRRANAARLQVLMAEVASTMLRETLFARAREGRVPCFPLNRAGDLQRDEQLAARRFFDKLTVDGQETPAPGLPFAIVSADGRVLDKARHLSSAPRNDALTEVQHA